MATIDVNPSIYFECPVCMEEIDDTWKMLPCQHVFCRSCLRNIYEAGRNQNPQCPTCRQVIAVPLEQLQKPRLLYEFYENLKTSQNRTTAPPMNDVDEDLIAAIELHSIDDERRRQEEFDKENENLQIALCKSADEAVLRAEMESLLHAEEKDLIAAVELSIRENKRTAITAMEMPKREAGKETTQASSDIDKTESHIPFCFNLSDFNNHLKSNGNLVLDTMLTVIEDDETLNSLESSEIALYLRTIDRYLNTLKCFRKNQIARIIQDFGEHREKYEHNLASGNQDSRGDSDKDDNVLFNNEDDDLTSLIRVLEVEKNEDAILKIVLKKSEVLDPVDKLCSQFLEIRKKLDRVFLNVAKKPISCNSIGTKYFSPLTFSPLKYFPSSSPQVHQATPSFPLPPASSLILPLPTVASRRSVQTTNHSLILPLPSYPNPSVSISRENVRASSVRGGHRGRGRNYRGSRGNERSYRDDRIHRGNHHNSYENEVDLAYHCENRGGFANRGNFHRGRGDNAGNRGARDVKNGGYKGRYFHRRR